MDALKLLIADGNEEFRTALEAALRDTYFVRSCATGQEALSLLRSFGPDILVLNLMLPEIDGITLLEDAIRMGIRPKVLATTAYQNAYILDAVNRLGVDYVMLRPCQIPAVVSRLRDLSSCLNPPELKQPDLKTHVTNLLLTLGVPTRLKGYCQVREAIVIMAKKPDMTITKELYPAVAEICGGDRDHVERTIRSAIAVAWKKRDPQVWQLYFPPEPDGICKRPSNGTFITRMVEALLLSRANSGADPVV